MAEDSGTSPADMAIMAESTSHVAGLESEANSGDPSPNTALGVFLSICEAVSYRFCRSDLVGLRVHIHSV